MTATLPPAWRLALWAVDLTAVAWGTLRGMDDAAGGIALLLVSLALATAIIVLGACEGITGRLYLRPWSAALTATAAVLASCAIALGLGIASGAVSCSRETAVATLAITIALPMLGRCLGWLTLRRSPSRRVLLLGPLACRIRVREHLARHPEARLSIVGEVGPGIDPGAPTPTWETEDLDAAVEQCNPDEILLSTGLDDRKLLLEALTRLLGRALVVRFLPDPESLPLFFPRPTDIAGQPAIDLSRGPLSPGAELIKLIEDQCVAWTALLILAVPMALIAVIIRLNSQGPALFIQVRHGQYGRPIRVFKFRTMRSDVCSPDIQTGQFKQVTAGDPRTTAFGRFLRNTSLDELPQFINVIAGDMSVVGPRPHAIAHNRRFATDIGDLMRRHYVKPGITGLAQISGARGETRTVEDMRRRVNYDLQYLRDWSLWLDLSIIAKTMVRGWINRHP